MVKERVALLGKVFAFIFSVLVIAALFLIYAAGFQHHTYDKNNKYIGTTFVFKQPMVLLTNIPDNYAGKYIAKEYGNYITSTSSWKNSSIKKTPGVMVNEIPCNEVFTVIKAFRRQSYGRIMRGYVPQKSYLVVSSNNHKQSVIKRSNYDMYALENSDASDDVDCANTEW